MYQIRIIPGEQPGVPWLVEYNVGAAVVRDPCAKLELALKRQAELEAQLPMLARHMRVQRLLAGTGFDPLDLIRLAGTGLSTASRFGDASKAFLAAAEKRLGCGSETLGNYRVLYRALDREFEDRPCDSITTLEFLAFLAKRTNKEGGPVSTGTMRTYRIAMMMILKFVGVKDPLPKLPKFSDKGRKVRFFTVAEVRRMLASTPVRERGLVGFGFFSCIAARMLSRITLEDIDVVNRTVRIRAEISPDGREHTLQGEKWLPNGRYLPGIPAVAFEWVAAFGYHPATWRNIQIRLTVANDGHFIQDGLRTTSATYHYFRYGEKPTEALLTQTGETLEWRKYVGEAEAKDAVEYFALSPTTIQFLPERAAYGHIADIPKEELQRLLWTMPMSALAAKLHVSLSGLFKRTRALGIRGPGQAYWGKYYAQLRRQKTG